MCFPLLSFAGSMGMVWGWKRILLGFYLFFRLPVPSPGIILTVGTGLSSLTLFFYKSNNKIVNYSVISFLFSILVGQGHISSISFFFSVFIFLMLFLLYLLLDSFFFLVSSFFYPFFGWEVEFLHGNILLFWNLDISWILISFSFLSLKCS